MRSASSRRTLGALTMTMETTSRSTFSSPVVWLGITLALGFVATALVVSGTLFRIRALSNVVAVTGSAEQTIVSDIAKWTASFSRNASSPELLKQESAAMSRDLETVLAYLESQGVARGMITVQPVIMNPLYGASKEGYYGSDMNRIVGYAFHQGVVVEGKGVEKIRELSQTAPAKLIDRGVVFSTQNVEYYYSGFSDLKVQLIANATENAKQRAVKIAEATGARIGMLQSAAMGVFQVTSVNSTDVSDYGFFDTSSVEKKVVSTVRASFSLE